MTTIMPEGDGIRKAVKWISEHLKENPDHSVKKLINEATLRFNLSPLDAEYLINFYRDMK